MDSELPEPPASRIQSIIQSLLFVQHVVGVQELESLTSSRRCLGVSGCRNTGPKRQADPFKVTDLVALHSVLLDSSRDSWDRCMAGMILLAVYSRSRWNDLQQAESMLLDCGPDGVVCLCRAQDSRSQNENIQLLFEIVFCMHVLLLQVLSMTAGSLFGRRSVPSLEFHLKLAIQLCQHLWRTVVSVRGPSAVKR